MPHKVIILFEPAYEREGIACFINGSSQSSAIHLMEQLAARQNGLLERAAMREEELRVAQKYRLMQCNF